MFDYNLEEKTSVVLAVSNFLYEYFSNWNVFVDMELITDPAMVSSLAFEYGLPSVHLFLTATSANPSAGFFIVKATDEREMVLKVIQENLHLIKILKSPEGLKEELKERIELFLKNEGLERSHIDGE
ncbi:hypothetical protein [Sulfuricurvum sp.]|uniref:hypothetical protein n=1 Tax=Sulfuricurvum sp. TaxID=2025608 RepID=UPI002D3DA1C4|nr:hypothetical protein [Sulfuricurvum sp.]HZF70946.1 hypothetical protein [Sulfuricurvum sp.]